MYKDLKTVLTIGGSDPTCGAGIQADIRTISSLGLHPLSVVTAITAQNSSGVSAVQSVSSEIFFSQINSLFDDVMPDAIKVGMCGSIEIAKEIADFLNARPFGIPAVIDPVWSATAGGLLIGGKIDKKNKNFTLKQIIEFYLKKIFPNATVITPNINEAKKILQLTGVEYSNLSYKDIGLEILKIAKSRAVVLKGGHDEETGNKIFDLLVTWKEDKPEFTEVCHEKINTQNLHGTGCVLSSLLACNLALGFSIKKAFILSSDKMNAIIRNSCNYELGSSKYGPLNINEYKL